MFFVQIIANLEGYKRVDVARPYGDATLQNVDLRLIVLERLYNVTSPPPMLDPTWESLEFRTRRLSRNLPLPNPLPNPSLRFNPNEVEIHVTPEAVQKLMVRLDPQYLITAPKSEDFSFDAIAQHVCYIAGTQNWNVPGTIKDLTRLYAVASELCIRIEDTLQSHGPLHRPMHPMRPGFPGGPMHPPSPCFRPNPSVGTCCSCHHQKGKPKVLQSRSLTTQLFGAKPSRKRNSSSLGWGWLGRLFGKKKVDYHSDTSSSGSESDTLNDE
ncbi:hypothetical protein TruAng_007264 [Truncatella angustata]|nr:hypothetical protein TruAng_007264 [Truncatella angustata]